MCPVSKEQVAAECGLDAQQITIADNDYLITDLNPNALGLTLAEAEIDHKQLKYLCTHMNDGTEKIGI